MKNSTKCNAEKLSFDLHFEVLLVFTEKISLENILKSKYLKLLSFTDGTEFTIFG
jgi:hypothetical protein